MKIIMFLIVFTTNLVAYGRPIIFGVVNNAPPFSSPSGDGKEFFGFNVDLTNGICDHLNIQCKIIGLPLVQLIPKLDSGEVDVISAPVPIHTNTGDKHIFSLPYLPSEAQILTLRSSNFNKVEDLDGKNVGVLRYTFYDNLSNSKYANMFNLKEYNVAADMGTALLNKQIDAVIINQRSASFIISNMVNNFKTVGNKFTIGEGYAMFALTTNADLIKQINQALLNMENDGSYMNIYNAYFSQ
ncbi:transporter substrate-binding domain-containing protein [Legionella waltersii]|uniref:Glutamine ABC transporter n=1 Tax=Legionella waltersii TaxID=66969 RepID=A0A0W1A5B5_9GAMM|nr:transporter substrate-binding domain-containing protein [Legionella waltersii]KTD76526.1 glutamine ABC transporter [Legionella waltersii]SNU93937.1 glutamine ABC transporter [Legionella waltersii]